MIKLPLNNICAHLPTERKKEFKAELKIFFAWSDRQTKRYFEEGLPNDWAYWAVVKKIISK